MQKKIWSLPLPITAISNALIPIPTASNAAAAGGQVSGKSVDEVAQELKEAIDQYFEK